MNTILPVTVCQPARVLCVALACLLSAALSAEEDGWNLPAAERVAEAEAAAARGDVAVAQRVLQQLQAGATAAGTLAERATAAAQVDRVRLALGRAYTKAATWEDALPLLTAIPLEGKSVGVQRAVCAALLDALAPLLLKPDSRIVTPWTPVVNDRNGPLQPNPALRAPYTRTDRRQAVTHLCSALADWERLAEQDAGKLTDSERATVTALDKTTLALVRYAWGLETIETATAAVAALPPDQRRPQTLRLARLLLDERDLKHAVPYLLDLERAAPKDETAKAAAEELLRIYCAHERLKTSLPMWNPGVAEAVRPYLKDPAWAQTREAILRQLDKAIGAVDMRVVLGEPEGTTAVVARSLRLESKHDTPPADPTATEASDIVVPPDILAKAELGDHFETINPDRPEDQHMFVAGADKEPLTNKDKEELAEAQKLKKEVEKLAGGKPNRYKKLGFLAGVLRKNILLTLDPKLAGKREVREEYELQVDHQEFMIEALGPSWQKDTSKGFRPLTPDAPLRLLVLTRYHGSVDLEARRLPGREAYEKMDGGLTTQQVDKLPVVKTFSLALPPLWTNLDPDATKRLVEIADHGLTPGFYVLLARARYAPVVAVTRLAISDTKLVVRHAPKEVLVWTLERLTGAPRPATKLSGDVTLEYVAATAWGDAPAGGTLSPAARATKPAWERTGFLDGFGDALNNRARQLGGDSYLAGVAEGKKQLAKFPPQTFKLPAESDANGLVRIPLPPGWCGHRCRIRAVANGCEVDTVETAQDLQAEKTERIVEWVADRPVVRPGQTVRLRGFVRESRNGRMSPARGGDVALRVDVGGATLFDATVPVDENGTCVFEQLIDADTPDGVLSACRPKTPGSSEKDSSKPLCAVRGGEMAARRLELELPSQPCAAGSRVKGRVVVESAAGMPLAGVPVRVQAVFHGYQWEQTAPLPFGDDLARAAKPVEAALKGWEFDQEVVSASNGEADFELELPEAQNSVAVVSARTQGGFRSAVSAAGKVLGLAGGCAWRVESAELPPLGKPAHVVLTAKTLSGEPYTKAFHIADEQDRLLATLTPDKDGRGSAEIQAPERGGLRIRPTEVGDGDWLPVYLTAPQGDTAEVRGRVLGARLDKREYRIGETAHLFVRTDRPNLTVLMTTEGTGITRATLLKIPGRLQDVEIVIGEQDAPNTTVALTTLADDLVDCVLVPLDIAQTERELTTRVESDRAVAEPGQTVTLTTLVTDSRGQPVADADVALAVYDRQLLTLASDPAPFFGRPFREANRAPHNVGWVTGFSAFEYGSGFLWLTPEWSYGPYAVEADRLMVSRGGFGTGTGVDSGSGRGSFGVRHGGGRRLMVKRHGGGRATESCFHVRSNFSEQALWVAHLRTGADGKVSAPFVAPDNLTVFHAVAYVLDKRGYPGTSRTEVTVRRDVEVTLDLPPELREGDQAEVAVCVWNHSGKKQSFELKTSFAVPVISSHLLADGQAKLVPKLFDLAPHSSVSVRYLLDVTPPPAGAPQPGADVADVRGLDSGAFGQMLRFDVSAAAPDGTMLDRAVFQAPLRFTGRPEREVVQIVARQGGSLRVPFPGSFDPKRTSLTVTLRRGLKGLALDVRELQYVFPEHCLEQTLSRFAPAVVLAEALGEAEQPAAERARLQSVLRSGVVRLRTLSQRSLDRDLYPLAAWYFQRLAETPAGRAVLRTDSDWLGAAGVARNYLHGMCGGSEKLEGWALPEEGARITPAYGGFRRDLWLAFGAAQGIHALKAPTQKREFRARFTMVCQSAVQLARNRKLEAHDRALAALLCATLGRRADAEELLATRGGEPAQGPTTDQRLARQAEQHAQQTRVVADALSLMAAVSLGHPETEIMATALRLEGAVSKNASAFGTTFVNGVALMAVADALKVCGGGAKAQPGPILLKLGGKAAAELPAGADLRRLTLDPAAVEAAYNDGWAFTVEAPEGQTVGLAVERRTLAPEKVGVLPRQEMERRIADLSSTPPQDANSPQALVRRALFVRAPNQKDVQFHEKWRPYSGQAVPRGTELLVVTTVLTAPDAAFTQIELPVLPGWETMVWNEQFDDKEAAELECQDVAPGTIAAGQFAAALNRDAGDGRSASAAVLQLAQTHAWATGSSRVAFNKSLQGALFSDRGSRFVLTPSSWVAPAEDDPKKSGDNAKAAPPPFFLRRTYAQSGIVRAAGRYQLPGARVWGWYDPGLEALTPADVVQVSDGPEATLEPPHAPLTWQPWLEKAWQLLARDGWKTKAYEGGGETVDLASLTLLALGHCAAPESDALIHEFLKAQPPPATLADFRAQRKERLALFERAALAGARPALRGPLLVPLASWDGLRQEWSAAGLPADEPPPSMKVLRAWADEEKARAEALLMALPPAERHLAIALQKRPLRDFAGLWFAKRDGGAQAAVDWLWSQPAADVIADFSGTLDEWARQLREQCGLNVRVDPRAPLVLSLPVPDKGESLRDYLANHLAAGEILAAGIEKGQDVVLQQIGLEPAGATPLTGPAAMELPVFFLGAPGTVLHPLQEALSLRGVQLVSPNAELKANKMLLRTCVHWLARLLDRGVRVEGTIIELK